MKQKQFVLEKFKYGGFNLKWVGDNESKTLSKFKTPNGDGIKLHQMLKSLKEGERIEIRKVK